MYSPESSLVWIQQQVGLEAGFKEMIASLPEDVNLVCTDITNGEKVFGHVGAEFQIENKELQTLQVCPSPCWTYLYLDLWVKLRRSFVVSVKRSKTRHKETQNKTEIIKKKMTKNKATAKRH